MQCHGPLDAGESLACPRCNRAYPVVEGIPSFDATDEFYDAYAEEHAPFVASPAGLKRAVLRVLPFWSWREWRFWEAEVPQCERLLDVGSGRGRETFAARAAMSVGYDVSARFLRDAATHYTHAVQGRLPRLPFSDSSFDVVVSSHVIGHVPPEMKDELIREIARVLVPGGKSVHLIETDSEHRTIVAAHGNQELYRKQFVEQDGHVGLELFDTAIRRFTAAGFRVERTRIGEAIVPSRQNYEKYLSHPDYADLPHVSALRRMARLTRSSSVANAAYEVLMGTFHHTIEQWLGRPARAQFVMVAFRKG